MIFVGGFPYLPLYHFAERSYPNPLTINQFVFDSPDPASNIDPIVQVNAVGDGVVRGVWYSRLFGRVGNFELYKDKPPALPPGVQKMDLVSGNYDGSGQWDFDILIKQGSAQSTVPNPFSPLTFAGYQFFRGTGKRDKILNGSYDFYTGRISLEAKDEAGERAHIGDRLSRRKLLLRSMVRETLTSLEDFEPKAFRLVGSRS